MTQATSPTTTKAPWLSAWLLASPAAFVGLTTVAHFATQFHPAAPFTPSETAIVFGLYAPALSLTLICLLPERFLFLIRWVNVLAAIWIAISLFAMFQTLRGETHVDLFSGAFFSSVGLTLTLILVVADRRAAFRKLIRGGIAILAPVYLLVALALPAAVSFRAQALAPNGCLFAFNQARWGADQLNAWDMPLLFQRFIAHRGRDYYTGAFRLELLDGDKLYHWSMWRLDFVATEATYLSNVGLNQKCAA